MGMGRGGHADPRAANRERMNLLIRERAGAEMRAALEKQFEDQAGLEHGSWRWLDPLAASDSVAERFFDRLQSERDSGSVRKLEWSHVNEFEAWLADKASSASPETLSIVLSASYNVGVLIIDAGTFVRAAQRLLHIDGDTLCVMTDDSRCGLLLDVELGEAGAIYVAEVWGSCW